MIYGTYHFRIDDKGRLQIPSKVKGYFDGSEICLVRINPEGDIKIYPKLSKPEEQELLNLNSTDEKRLEYFSRQPKKIDSQKRIGLDKKFRSLEVTLIGNGDHLIAQIQK